MPFTFFHGFEFNMWTIAVLVLLAVAALYYILVRPLSYWKRLNVTQANPVILLGDYWTYIFGMESYAEMLRRLYNQFPNERYIGIYQLRTPTLMLRCPELIKRVTVKDFDHFVDHRNVTPESADPLWGKNLFSLDEDRWREMRPVLQPAFTSSKMKLMFQLVTECAEDFVAFFLEKNQDLIEVELRDTLSRFANDAIATSAYGVKVNSVREPENEFYTTSINTFTLTPWVAFKFFASFYLSPFWLTLFNLRVFTKKNSEFFIRVIDETIKAREERGIIRPDLIHLLMEARKEQNRKYNERIAEREKGCPASDLGKPIPEKVEITNVDIAAQAMVFSLGGFDSSASVMCFLAYELAIHQDLQQKLRDEINDTLAKCNGVLTYEALMEMKYIDMVVSEALRKWSNGVILDRVSTKPYDVVPLTPDEKPFRIPVRTVIMIPGYALQHDPKFFPDPDRFDPERFNDENKRNVDPYTNLPFGIGPRSCLGQRFGRMETKVLFFHLVSKFKIVPTAKSVIPMKPLLFTFNMTAEDGFKFAFERIKEDQK